MTFTKQPLIFLLLLALVTLFFMSNSSNAAECAGSGSISVYWGSGSDASEGSLEKACATGNYDIVILQGINVFDNGRQPLLTLGTHCGSVTNPCTKLQSQIEYCQENNIKVFLSIIQDLPAIRGSHSASSSEGLEQEIADYLLENYLSGQSGPLGSVSLDGIDIMDVPDSSNIHWDELVKAINASTTERKIYLSASPQCVYPDAYLNNAIRTGLLDYVWVEFFYQNPSCIYSNGDASKLLSAWKTWTSRVPNSLIFLGLTASSSMAGYIPPETLISDVLPTAREASNYGGVMIWSRISDKSSNYSGQIKDSVPKVCQCVCNDPLLNSYYGMRHGSLPLKGFI